MIFLPTTSDDVSAAALALKGPVTTCRSNANAFPFHRQSRRASQPTRPPPTVNWTTAEEWQIVEFFSRDWQTYNQLLCERNMETLQLLLWEINHLGVDSAGYAYCRPLYGNHSSSTGCSFGFGRRAMSQIEAHVQTPLKTLSDLDTHLGNMFTAYTNVMTCYDMNPNQNLVAKASNYHAVINEFLYVEQWNRVHVHTVTLFPNFKCNAGRLFMPNMMAMSEVNPTVNPTHILTKSNDHQIGTHYEAMESTLNIPNKGLEPTASAAMSTEFASEEDITNMNPDTDLRLFYSNENSDPQFDMHGAFNDDMRICSTDYSQSFANGHDQLALHPQITVTTATDSERAAAQDEYRQFVLEQLTGGKPESAVSSSRVFGHHSHGGRRSSRVRHALKSVFKRKPSHRYFEADADMGSCGAYNDEDPWTSADEVPLQSPPDCSECFNEKYLNVPETQDPSLECNPNCGPITPVSPDTFVDFSQGRLESEFDANSVHLHSSGCKANCKQDMDAIQTKLDTIYEKMVALEQEHSSTGPSVRAIEKVQARVYDLECRLEQMETGHSRTLSQIQSSIHSIEQEQGRLLVIEGMLDTLEERQSKILDTSACFESNFVDLNGKLDVLMHCTTQFDT